MGGKGSGRKRKVRGTGRGGGGEKGGALEKCEVKPRARKAAIRPCIDCLYIRPSVVGCRFGPNKNFGVAPPMK